MLRNPKGLSQAVVVLLGVTVAADVFSIVATLRMRALLTGPLADHPDPDEYEGELDTAMAWTAQSLLLLATAVVFVTWFFRLRRNADVWAPDLQRRAKAWAIAGWFVPIVSLWVPRGVAADIWRASRPEPYAADRRGEFVLLNGWWLSFVAATFVGEVGYRIFDDARNVDTFVAGANWIVVGDLLNLTAAVLAILVVRRLTSMQHTKATGMIPAAQ
ncbi:DUF4328 domain-containing protein [Streptomyces sp. NPDC012769]|uniref:DUF4328 domain-containing protein n=1 Tax=Streptomyces sp. NPDC012769 TaxID=3364848 RepID=UPI003691C9BE